MRLDAGDIIPDVDFGNHFNTTAGNTGPTVTSVTPTPTGFTMTFNSPINPADIYLYNSNTTTSSDVTLVGNNGVNVIHGTLLIDPTGQTITFKATSSYLQEKNALNHPTDPRYDSVVLPDATYTLTLVSGSGNNGFFDTLGNPLDGAGNGGHANFTTTFTTHFQAAATPVLALPDFARGPDSSTPIRVTTFSSGIPITLYDAPNVTDVTFSMTYNASLLGDLGAWGGPGSDASDQNNSNLILVSNTVANGIGVATYHYAGRIAISATPDAPLVLGDVTALVASAAGSPALSLYKVKELLQLSNIIINQGGLPGAVASDGLHVNAYFGDVSGDGIISGLDTLDADLVAQGRAKGFTRFCTTRSRHYRRCRIGLLG